MIYTKSKNIVIILLFISLSVKAQVINIEQERIGTDTTGITGTAQMAFQYMKNKSEAFNIDGDLHLQYKTKKSTVLTITDYTFSKTQGTDYANAGIQHFRYDYKINPWLYSETFTQVQFNKILNVKLRWLMGAGPRFRMIKANLSKNKNETGNLRIYLGILYMYEYEELDNAVYNRDHRLSSYLSLSYKMGKNISIINTTYNQPKLSNFKDYRIYSQTDIKMVFSKHFAFKVSYVYSFDTNPALNVPKIDQAFKNSISFEF